MSRLLIADGHSSFRQSAKQSLALAFPGLEVGEAGSVAELDAALARPPWDLLLLDVGLLEGKTGEKLEELRRSHSRLPVILLSAAPEISVVARAMRAGAAGYVGKEFVTEEIGRAVDAVLAGAHFVSPSLLEQLPAEVRRGVERPRHEALSLREQQVCQLSAEGKPLKEIAAELGLSPKTVSTFRLRAFGKLGIRDHADLARYVREHGLK